MSDEIHGRNDRGVFSEDSHHLDQRTEEEDHSQFSLGEFSLENDQPTVTDPGDIADPSAHWVTRSPEYSYGITTSSGGGSSGGFGSYQPFLETPAGAQEDLPDRESVEEKDKAA